MKHFLRKLHLGGGSTRDDHLDGGRSSDATSSSSPFWGLSDWFSSFRHSHNHNQITEHSASARGRLEGAAVEGSSKARLDYDSLEEEYQVQLALALSVSNEQPIDPESMEIEAVKRISLGLCPAPAANSQAEMAAYRYWAYNVLNYDDRVLNGFYDVYGVVSDPKHPKRLPSLVDLQGEPVSSTLSYEVVLVNRETDAELVKLEKRARLARAECRGNSGGPLKSGLAQKIAIMVSEQMGGLVEDDDGMLSVWKTTSWELKSSFHSNVLPLGYLHIGLARHRALLFKVLADCVGIPCRLVKGRHYTGADEGAVNIIRDIDNREYIIDLMGAPGSVIPPDADDKKAANLGERHHSEPAGMEDALERRPRPSHGRSPSWTEGIGIRQAKAKDMSQYVIDAAKENPVLAQKLHDALVESGVAAPPEFLAELSPKELQKKDTSSAGQEARKGGRIAKERGKPPLKPARVDDKERLQRLKSVEGLGDRRPLESPIATSVLSAVHENFPAEFIKNSPVAASAITAAVVASSMVVAAAKSDSSEEVPITAAATATAAVVAATSAAVVLKSESSSGHSDRGGGSGDNKSKEKGGGTEDNKKSGSGQRNKKDDAGVEDERSSVLEDVAEWEIPWEELVVGERIGLGSYGEVYRGDWRGTEVAIKKFLDQDISGDALEEFITEVRLMRRMRHPNVVLFMGAVTRPPHLSIVTEFLPRGSLFKLLHRTSGQLDERRRMRMALDVAKGMNYLHTSTPIIVHRDLKSPNLLVDKNWVVKVCDFGLSRMKHHTFLSSKSQAGTPEWMAPEVLRNEPSDEKADVYSFGVILWELATMQQPWHGMNPMQVVGAVGFQNRRLDIPADMDPAIAKIIQGCWHNDPRLRPSFGEIMRSLRPFQRPVIASQSDSGKQKVQQQQQQWKSPTEEAS